MPYDYNTVIGSGSLPNLQPSPIYDFPADTFPVPHAKDNLLNRRGEGVVILNPSDFSISIGGRVTQVDVTTSAVEILASPLEFRRAIVLHNNGGSTVYIGFTSALTTADGFPLTTNEKIAIDMVGNPNLRIWLISDSSSDVRLMELA